MWIKKLYATFGKLENKDLELARGLNIVCGENETGKSTWGAFIRTMLYGISTRDRSKSGYLADKDKYKPWCGSDMYGRAEISKNGEDIIIERTAGRTGVFSKERAYKEKTGESVETGQALTGAELSTYLKTAFIDSAEMSIKGDSDTERRILSATTSGDEDVSATEVMQRIKKRMDALLPPKKKDVGIPKLRAERDRLLWELSDARDTEEKISETAENLKASRERVSSLERQRKIAEFEEKKARYSLREDAEKALSESRAEKERVASFPTRETEEKIRAYEKELMQARFDEEMAEKSLDSQRENLRKAEVSVSENRAFGGMSRDEAKKALESEKKQKRGTALYIMFACSAILLCAGIYFALQGNFILLAAWALHGAVTVLMAVGIKRGGNPELTELSLSEYFEALDRFDDEKRVCDEKQHTLEAKRLERKNAEGAFRNSLLGVGIFEDDCEKAMAELLKKVSERENAEREYMAAESRFTALSDSLSDETPSVEYSEDEIPSKSAERIGEELSSEKESVRAYEIELARLNERNSGMSAADSEKKLRDVEDALSEAEFSYSAARTALEVMEISSNEIKNRFSPELEKRTAEIFRELTGGSFEIVRITGSDFSMSVAEKAASSPRDVLSLSGGTYDELYFSLRLALCDMIFDGADIPPIVLDDVFVNFDDVRMARALELLSLRAERAQIILFTCHTREAEYMKNRENVNIIRI